MKVAQPVPSACPAFPSHPQRERLKSVGGTMTPELLTLTLELLTLCRGGGVSGCGGGGGTERKTS